MELYIDSMENKNATIINIQLMQDIILGVYNTHKALNKLAYNDLYKMQNTLQIKYGFFKLNKEVK